MNRNLLIVIYVFLSIVVTLLLGNIITIGDKLGQITHVYAEYTFYIAVLSLSFIYILRPIIKVHRAPEFPKLSVDENMDSKQLYSFAKKLSNNCDYISDAKIRKAHRKEFYEDITRNNKDVQALREYISQEISIRIEGDDKLGVLGINERIKEWATSVFMVTAVSQSSKIDTIAVMLMNYKMISDIVLASGFRPTKPQMFKIYVRVLTTALITYCISQVFTDVDGVAPFDIADNSGAVADNIMDQDMSEADICIDESNLEETIMKGLTENGLAKMIIGSVTQGCLNALMTLRIGYVTKAYLTEGPMALNGIKNKRRVKWQARKSAVASLPSVVLKGGAVLSKSVQRVLETVL